MSCERHPNSGVVIVGTGIVCYGCFVEPSPFCPLCGQLWELCSCPISDLTGDHSTQMPFPDAHPPDPLPGKESNGDV